MQPAQDREFQTESWTPIKVCVPLGIRTQVIGLSPWPSSDQDGGLAWGRSKTTLIFCRSRPPENGY